MFRVARTLARLARAASRRIGRTGGTTAPGRLLLKASPRALQRMSSQLDAGSVLVSATNGKTTTAAMIAASLERAGRPVVHNRAGSNMSWGVATALIDAGRERGQLGLFEVDEAWLPAVARDTAPRLLLLSNLFRDQLDRYGELELLADRWAELTAELEGRARFVLNADDPLVADLGRDRSPNCGRTRPEPQVAATSVTLDGMKGSRVELRTPQGELRLELRLPGLYNVYNAVAAAATALELGVPLATVGEALAGFGGAFGRVETIPVSGRQVSILLIKNPAGANEVLRTLTLEDGRLDLWIALNDRIADGRDISWIWDADFEVLAGRVGRVTCSGTRAEEMALRLKYAGMDAKLAVDRDLGDSLDAAVANAAGERVYALPTYTALLELRDLLASRGLAKRWSE